MNMVKRQNRDGFTSIRINKEFWIKVRHAAIDADRDVSQYIEDALKEKMNIKVAE